MFDFKKKDNLAETFCGGYLHHYYCNSRIAEDEIACFDFIRDVVLPKLHGTESFVELGCGPTVHHAIMVADHVASLYLADYLEENVAAVEAWKNNHPNAWDWGHYASLCISRCNRESSPEAIQAREDITRDKLLRVSTCNLLDEHPISDTNARFDIVSAFYCTEVVAPTIERWRQVMFSLGNLTTEDGYILIGGLYGTSEYRHIDDSGNPHFLPSTCVDDRILFATLEEMGFEVLEDGFQHHVFPSLLQDNIQGVYFLFAKKKEM